MNTLLSNGRRQSNTECLLVTVVQRITSNGAYLFAFLINYAKHFIVDCHEFTPTIFLFSHLFQCKCVDAFSLIPTHFGVIGDK